MTVHLLRISCQSTVTENFHVPKTSPVVYTTMACRFGPIFYSRRQSGPVPDGALVCIFVIGLQSANLFHTAFSVCI